MEQDKGKQQAAASPLRAFWTKQLGGERPAFEKLKPISFGPLVHVLGCRAVHHAVTLASPHILLRPSFRRRLRRRHRPRDCLHVCVCVRREGREVVCKGQRGQRVLTCATRDMWPPRIMCDEAVVCVTSVVRSHRGCGCVGCTYLNRILLSYFHFDLGPSWGAEHFTVFNVLSLLCHV